jgi:hypothetical protein
MGRDVAWSAFASSRQQQRPHITEATTVKQIPPDCETIVVTKCVHYNDTGSSSSPHPTTEAHWPMTSRDHSTSTEAPASKSPLDRGSGQQVTTRPRLQPETSPLDRGSSQKRHHSTEAPASNVTTRPRLRPVTSPHDRGSGQQVTNHDTTHSTTTNAVIYKTSFAWRGAVGDMDGMLKFN